jgi:phosphatidylserine decarboxylase
MSIQETLIFAVTSYVPRRLVTRFMGWFSKLEQPLVRDVSMAVWQRFEPLDLSDAVPGPYKSLHAVFTRALVPGARPFDADERVLASPSDGIVVGAGVVEAGTLIQAKGHSYGLSELVCDPARAALHEGASYVTLRLTPAMYHRFHAPARVQLRHVTYVAGDAYNTHPAALARVPRLYCKNERAVLHGALSDGAPLTLVPVAAVLVASIRLHFLDVTLHLRYAGPNELPCDAHAEKGEELGWFEHGSTIVVLAPRGARLAEGVALGRMLRAGEALFRR